MKTQKGAIAIALLTVLGLSALLLWATKLGSLDVDPAAIVAKAVSNQDPPRRGDERRG